MWMPKYADVLEKGDLCCGQAVERSITDVGGIIHVFRV